VASTRPMIRKQDILERAGEWTLRRDIVEKDFRAH
jgi:hypothetical protein